MQLQERKEAANNAATQGAAHTFGILSRMAAVASHACACACAEPSHDRWNNRQLQLLGMAAAISIGCVRLGATQTP
eukprot:351121-Chlamydomonas_euryale.AAC.4